MSVGPTPAPSPTPTPAPAGLSTVIDQILSHLTALNGIKTYLAAAGLFGLALYQLSTKDLVGAWSSLMAALAAVGLRHAVAKSAV